ncbi:MAG: helix-turn-helix domain-containing protein [Acidimicrobiales bacterium]
MHPALEMIRPLADALGGELVGVDDLVDGDIVLRWEGQVVGGFRPAGLDRALDRLVATVEAQLGGPIDQLGRDGKQEAVRRLDQLGAFTLRRAVEDIADRLKVSRFTVYNYLNASIRGDAMPTDGGTEGETP